MNITINDESINVPRFTSPKTFLLQYAQRRKGLDRYFNFDPPPFESVNYTTTDIRTILEETDLDDLEDVYTSEIEGKFNVKKREAMLMWLDIHSFKESDFRLIRDFYSFATKDILKSEIQHHRTEFKRDFERERDELNELLRVEKIYRETDVTLTHTPFVVDTLDVEVKLKSHSYSIIQLFDSIRPSIVVPFMKCNVNGKVFTKIDTEFPISDDWAQLEVKLNELVLVFQQVSSFDINKTSHVRKLDVFYTTATFISTTSFLTTILLEEDADDKEIINNLLNQFEIDLQQKEIVQRSVRGKFKVDDLMIDRDVWAALVSENDVFKHIFLLDESRAIVTHKTRFYVVYHQRLDEYITITITSSDDGGISVRVPKVENDEQANDFIHLFMVCCQIYVDEFKNVVKGYKKMCAGFKPAVRGPLIATTGVEKEKVKKKTGQRLDKLKDVDPEMFGGEYNKVCQGSKQQPRIVSAQEAAKITDDDKVMEFPLNSGRFYTCDPIEPITKKVGNKTIETFHSYPGLRKNRHSNADKYPYLPCCYPKPQKSKKSSGYAKWFDEVTGVERVEVVSKKTIENILNPQNVLPADRKGELTYNVKTLLEYSQVNTDSILRFGVVEDPFSIVHCICYGLDVEGYRNATVESREGIVNNTLNELAEGKVVLLKQTYYQYTLEEITTVFSERKAVNPNTIIELLEYHFNTNIFLFTEQDITIPNNKNGYILPPKQYDGSLIIHSRDPNHQCELLIDGDDATFLTSTQRELLEGFFAQRLALYTIDDLKPLADVTAEFRDTIVAQNIDYSGKARAFELDNNDTSMLVFTPPTYPSHHQTFEINLKKYKTTPTQAVKFIEKVLESTVKFQYVEGNKCKGVQSTQGVYVYCSGNKLNSVKNAKLTFVPPYKFFSIKGDVSMYEVMKHNRNVSDVLKNYTLKGYSSNKRKFNIKVNNKVTFEGEVDVFDVDIDQDTSFYNTSTATLAVPSKEIKRRLETFLEVSKFYIPTLLDDGIVPSVSPQNFINRPNQLIFLDDNNITLMKWIDTFEDLEYLTTIQNGLTLDHTVKQPYVASIDNVFNGKTIIVQNVEGGGKLDALYVSMKWTEESSNEGYYANAPVDFEEKIQIMSVDDVPVGEGYPVLRYPNVDNLYAAILQV